MKSNPGARHARNNGPSCRSRCEAKCHPSELLRPAFSAASSAFIEKTLRGQAGAVTQARELGPDNIFGHASPTGRGVETAVGTCKNPGGVTDYIGHPFDPVGNHLGMFDEIGEAVDYTRNEHLVCSEGKPLEAAKFMGVTRIREWQYQGAHVSLEKHGQYVLEGDIAVVRRL
jgi:hypothetical protein